MCFDFLYRFYLKEFSFSEKFRDIIRNVRRPSCKVTIIPVRFYSNLNVVDRFSKKKIPKKSNFTKIHPVEAELFHADRRTDGHDKANCHFSQFCECAQ